MQVAEIDWLELWQELVSTVSRSKTSEWPNSYKIHFRKKTRERRDPLFDFILKDTDTLGTILDIGAGNGRWTIPIARVARNVTAVEPSDYMVNMLRENIAVAGLNNIQILQAIWEESVVVPHDVVVSAHAIYSTPDFAACVLKMDKYARKRCYLAVRLPPYNGIIGELSLQIYGHRHDSPNAIIAYNALYSMGIYANLLVEDDIYHWVDSSFEEAFARAKRHLRLESTSSHDKLIYNALDHRLTYSNNSYVWPDGMRSALLWWNPRAISKQ